MAGENFGEILTTPVVESKPKPRSEGVRRILKKIAPIVFAGAYVAGGGAARGDTLQIQQPELSPAPITIPGEAPKPSRGIEISPPPVESPIPQETSPSNTPKPEVKDLKTSIEEKYGISIVDLGDLDKDLQSLDSLLQAIPKKILESVAGNTTIIEIVDKESQKPAPQGTIRILASELPQNDMEVGVEINRSYVKIITDVIEKKDSMNGHSATKTIMNILGPDFANNLGNSSPELRNVFLDKLGRTLSSEQIHRNLIEFYLTGFDNFNKINEIVGPIGDNLRNVMLVEFDGYRVLVVNNGYPQLVNPSVPQSPPPAVS